MYTQVRVTRDRSPVDVGCPYWDNCFTCKFHDCRIDTNQATRVGCGHKKRKAPLAGQPVFRSAIVDKVKIAWKRRQEGKILREIAKELGVSISTVGGWLRDIEDGGVDVDSL